MVSLRKEAMPPCHRLGMITDHKHIEKGTQKAGKAQVPCKAVGRPTSLGEKLLPSPEEQLAVK